MSAATQVQLPTIEGPGAESEIDVGASPQGLKAKRHRPLRREPSQRAVGRLPHYRLERFREARDWFTGWRDGRRGLPDVTYTPLRASALDRLDHELAASIHALETDVASTTYSSKSSLEGLKVHRQGVEALYERRSTRLKEEREQGPNNDRRQGEATLSQSSVKLRREREHQSRISYLIAQVTEAANELARYSSAVKRLESQIASFEETSRARQDQVHQLFQRRKAAYFRGVERSHEKPGVVSGRVPSGYPTEHAYLVQDREELTFDSLLQGEKQ